MGKRACGFGLREGAYRLGMGEGRGLSRCVMRAWGRRAVHGLGRRSWRGGGMRLELLRIKWPVDVKFFRTIGKSKVVIIEAEGHRAEIRATYAEVVIPAVAPGGEPRGRGRAEVGPRAPGAVGRGGARVRGLLRQRGEVDHRRVRHERQRLQDVVRGRHF